VLTVNGYGVSLASDENVLWIISQFFKSRGNRYNECPKWSLLFMRWLAWMLILPSPIRPQEAHKSPSLQVSLPRAGQSWASQSQPFHHHRPLIPTCHRLSQATLVASLTESTVKDSYRSRLSGEQCTHMANILS
jgi:hypothetical protein